MTEERPKAHTGDVDALRKVLAYYDEGVCTAGEVGWQILQHLLAPHIEALKQGKDSGWGGPWCGAEPPPPWRATIEFGANRLWFYPEHPVKDSDPVLPDAQHEWETTQWGYDFYAYTCTLCKLETTTRRGYPARTVEECLKDGIQPCKGPP